MEKMPHLMTQWQGLHSEVASLDRAAMLPKIISAATLLLPIFRPHEALSVALFLFFLLICEVLIRTYQSRSMERLVAIEESGQNKHFEPVYLHYQQQARSLTAMVNEYIANMIKPTVMPYYAAIGCGHIAVLSLQSI